MTDDVPHPGALSFDEASRQVIEVLRSALPMSFWSVSQHVDGCQVHLHVHDEEYGTRPGDSHPWRDALCRHALTGATPRIAPRAMAVPEYAGAGLSAIRRIGAYVGIPIPDGEGGVFGTICGMDPAIRPDDFAANEPLLGLLATLLGQVRLADGLRGDPAHREARPGPRTLHDPLTGLANRDLFMDRLRHAADLQRRDLRTISVLLVDLDRFRAVNDTLGRAGGDLVLVEAARRLRGLLRVGDTTARLGGDTFAVLIEDGGQAATVAHKLVDVLGQPFAVENTLVTVGASIGVVEVVPFGAATSPETVLAQADAALHTAKRSGRGRFDVHPGDPALDASPPVPGRPAPPRGR